jgi:hypothetical protein
MAESIDEWFELLWRGTRDGFSASEFHRRCDGRGNTVTIVEAIGGSIFGGFTPIAWTSNSNNNNNSSGGIPRRIWSSAGSFSH